MLGQHRALRARQVVDARQRFSEREPIVSGDDRGDSNLGIDQKRPAADGVVANALLHGVVPGAIRVRQAGGFAVVARDTIVVGAQASEASVAAGALIARAARAGAAIAVGLATGAQDRKST